MLSGTPPGTHARPHRGRKPAELGFMTVSGIDPSNQYAVAVQKLAQNQEKREGEQAVALIEGASPPTGPNGEGTHVNTYA